MTSLFDARRPMCKFQKLQDEWVAAPYMEDVDLTIHGVSNTPKNVHVDDDTISALCRGLIYTIDHESSEWGRVGITGYPAVCIAWRYTCTAIAKGMDIAVELLEALREGEFNPDGLGDDYMEFTGSIHKFYEKYFDEDTGKRRVEKDVTASLRKIQSVLDVANQRTITEGEYVDACGAIVNLFKY